MNIFPPDQLLVLPTSLAVARERARLLDQSPAGVILNLKIFTFGGLEAALAAEIGPENHSISELSRNMLLEKLIETGRAQWGWPVRPCGPGLLRRIAQLLDQLKTSAVGPEELADLAEDVLPPNQSTCLIELDKAYEEFLSTRGLTDRAGIRRTIIEGLSAGLRPGILDKVKVISIQNFHRLTPFQLALIKALAVAVNRVAVHLQGPDWLNSVPLDPDRDWTDIPFSQTLSLIRDLESVGEQSPGLELVLTSPEPDSTPPALAWVKDRLFNPGSEPEEPAPSPGRAVEILAAPGRYAEVEEVGRRIWVLLEQGVSPEEIAIGVSDLGVFGPLFEDVFRRFKLPLVFRRGAPLIIQAPVRALLALLRLADSHWNRELVLDVLASPYLQTGLQISWARAAELSARAGVTDDRAGGGWTENLTKLAVHGPEEDRADIENLLQTIGRLKELLRPWRGSQTWPDFLETSARILDALQFEQALQTDSDPALHRDVPAWAALRECLNDLLGAAEEAGRGKELFTSEDLARHLRLAMEGLNVGQSRTGQGRGNGGVMVLNFYDLHGLVFDHLFLAGLNEGEFPRPRLEARWPDDDQRRLINEKAGFRLLNTSAWEYTQEELIFYFALAAAGQGLTLSYSRSDERGRIRLPSAVVDEVLRLWPPGVLPVQDLPFQILPPLSQALTREELIAGLSRNLLAEAQGSERDLAREILAGFLDRPEEEAAWKSAGRRVAMERSRELSETGPFSGQVEPGVLEPWLTQVKRYQDAPVVSPSFFERYGQCPFSFWAGEVLGLDTLEEPEDEIKRRDEGSILHEILYRFLTRCRDEKRLPLKGLPEETRLLLTVAGQVWAEAEQTRALGRRPLWRLRRRTLERTLLKWLEFEQKNTAEFRPAFFEWGFGPKEKTPPLMIPLLSGEKIYIKGRVDRIDLAENQGLLIDYKNSGDRYKYVKLLREEELGLTSFQMPLYQAAADQAWKRPCQAAFVLLRRPEMTKKSPATDSDLFTPNLDKRKAMAEHDQANFFNRLEATWLRLLGGDFSPRPQAGPCDFCAFFTVCRAGEDRSNA